VNIKEYISSGILELYVLGDLTLEERQEVERAIAEYPEIREELHQVEIAQEEFYMQNAVPPEPATKKKIFARLPEQKEVVMSPDTSSRSLRILRFVVAASISLALVAGVLAFTYYNNWQESQARLSELIAQNQQIADNYNQVNDELNKIQGDLQVINNPRYARIPLEGTEGSPDAGATVYWNKETSEVYLSIQNLKQLAQNQQFQLWAIIDGKPVDAGIVNSDMNGILRMKNIANASAFAITIEPEGGSASPTLDTMQVMGVTG
jgi:anti-sigma-K factor RskA